MKRIAIVGGGASGLSAAIEAGRESEKRKIPVSVTVFERNPRVGKKLLLTGNGRCNLTNTHLWPGAYNTPRAMEVIRTFSEEDTRSFFAGLGVPTCCDEAGRVYPHSMQAGCVVNALRGEAERIGIQLCTGTQIESVQYRRGFILSPLDRQSFDSVIIAGGGCAYPATGSDGNGLQLLKSMGIPCVTPHPSLTGLKVPDRDFRSLKGVRARADVTLLIDGKCVKTEHGEVQFADYGVSGIAVMQLSRLITRRLNGQQACRIALSIDLAPDLDKLKVETFLGALCRRSPQMQAADLLAGIVPRQMGFYLLKRCGVPIGENTCGNIPHDKVIELASQIKAFCLNIVAVRGFEQAQVTAGGADLRAFDSNLMARRIPGLFACGEVLDVDGMCGGYNLEWAFSSGRLCGKSAVDFLMEERP